MPESKDKDYRRPRSDPRSELVFVFPTGLLKESPRRSHVESRIVGVRNFIQQLFHAGVPSVSH